MKVMLLENIHPKAVEVFQNQGVTQIECIQGALQKKALIEKLQGVQILGIRSQTEVSREILEKAPTLLTVGCFCIGTNQIDLKAAKERGIPVFNDPHSNTRSVAEFVIALCIDLMRGIIQKNRQTHLGIWKKQAGGSHEIRGKILGIVGYGRIGSQVSILAEAMGMQVIYFDIEQKLSLGNAKPVSSLEELLKLSDIVTVHVPETGLTHLLVDRKRIGLMKKTAFLINTSRGKVVDLEALAQSLTNQNLAGAAIDVFKEEPKNAKEVFQTPLQGIEQAILTPHIAGSTEEAQENIGSLVSQKLLSFITRGSSEGATNFPEITLPPIEKTHRILHIHQNVPGMLSQINKVLADRKSNILAQYLKTFSDIGYVVFDIEKKDQKGLLKELEAIQGTIRARVLY